MKNNGSKPGWIETALSIQKFHIEHIRDDIDWKLEDTAKSLKRSLGSISQYLTIASWLRTHEKQIRRFDTAKEALTFIKKQKRQMLLDSFGS